MAALKSRHDPSPYFQQSSTTRASTAPPTTSRPQSLLSATSSFPRSPSLPASLENHPTSDLSPSIHPSVASPEQPKSLTCTPTRRAILRKRAQRTVRIINATYAVCMRLPLDPETRSLAFPVYPTSESSFLIPATRSHYRTLRAYIYRTDARSVSIEFLKAARLPGRTSPVPCIALNMPSVGHELLKVSSALIADDIKRANWQYKGKPFNVLKTGKATRTLVTRRKIWSQEPYESFALPGREFPFLVVEVADSQRHKDLIKKLHRWAQGSKAQCKVMIAFELEKLPRGDYRILMSVTKNKKVPIPEPPNGFRVVSDTVHDRVDISSQNYTGSFTISATEVCPEEWELDAVTKASDITISFNQFRGSALAAIEEKMAEVARNAQGDPTPDPDQEDVSTPSSSESGSLADELLALESESEEDDAQDPDYED